MAAGRSLEAFNEASTARSFGLTIARLRYYSFLGLLKPKTFQGDRYYGEHERERLAVIQKAQQLRFTLSEIQKLLNVKDISNMDDKYCRSKWLDRADRNISASHRRIYQSKASLAEISRYISRTQETLEIHLSTIAGRNL